MLTHMRMHRLPTCIVTPTPIPTPTPAPTECCLEYPHASSYFWNGIIHFSTRDCLYEAGGGYIDSYGDWNNQEPGRAS